MKASWYKSTIELLVWIGGAILFALLLRYSVIEKVQVQGSSMLPNFMEGQQLFVDKVSYRFREAKRFEVVIVDVPEEPERYIIKRVIGLPGETVQIKEGKVYINGKPLDGDIYPNEEEILDGGIAEEEIVLRQNEYFVLGDNRNRSKDSRDLGPIKKQKIVGRVALRIWPLGEVKVF